MCQENLSPPHIFHGLEAAVCTWTLSGILAQGSLCVFGMSSMERTPDFFASPNPTFVTPKTFTVPGHSVNATFGVSMGYSHLWLSQQSLTPQI